MLTEKIQTEEEFNDALRQIERLFSAPEGTPESDRLEHLIDLADAYEKENYPVDPPFALDAAEYDLEKNGLSRQDLEKVLGPAGLVSQILESCGVQAGFAAETPERPVPQAGFARGLFPEAGAEDLTLSEEEVEEQFEGYL